MGATARRLFFLDQARRGSAVNAALVAYWALSNTSDALGVETLTNVNTVTFVAGKVGNAAHFVTGSSQSLTRAGDSNLDLTQGAPWTVAGWLKLNTTGLYGIISKESTGINFEIELRTDTSLIICRVSDGITIKTASKSFTFSTGTYYFFSARYTPSTQLVEIDVNVSGSPGTVTLAQNIPSFVADPLAISHNNAGFSFFDGDLDEIGIWRAALTNAQLSYLYNGGAGRTYPFPGAP